MAAVLAFAGCNIQPPPEHVATQPATTQPETQEQAIAAIRKLGGLVDLYGKAPGTPFMVDWMDAPKDIDDGLKHIEGFTELQKLILCDSHVTDAGMAHLKGATRLRLLYLHHTKVTDAGMVNLKGLVQLQTLLLDGTKVTDSGLKHLKGLHQLETLDLRGTGVTEQGVKQLQEALPKCHIRH